jgi:hypothetical protein
MGKHPKPAEMNPARPIKQPYRSRLGGLLVILLAGLLAAAAAYYANYAYARSDFWQDDAQMILLLLIAAGGALGAGRKMMAPSAEEVLATDHRNPVVYLRPFDEDSRRVEHYPVGRRKGGRPTGNGSKPASNEKFMAKMLREIGPFVAVGAPGDALAPLGAARLYLGDDQWQQEVEALVRRASAVILVPEISEGTRWEVTKVAQWVDPRRVLMLVPNPALRPLGYARIQALTAEKLTVALPRHCSNADAFMFNEISEPQPIIFGRNAKASLAPFMARLRLLQPAGHA